MNLAIISFTKAGSLLNDKVASLLEKEHNCISYYKGRCEETIVLKQVLCSLQEWCQDIFNRVDGILFIGATGIAVRTIAPFIQNKTKDPLVLVIDEKAKFVISLLSGHIGGGNELTIAVSDLLKAIPVITTATDINHRLAVDVFARKENLHISDMKIAKEISASILEGKKIGVVSRVPILGELPEELVLLDYKNIDADNLNTEANEENIEADKENIEVDTVKTDADAQNIENKVGICISLDEEEKPFYQTLNLIPRRITIGVGCKKNTDSNQFEEYICDTLKSNHISIYSIKNIASIDLKAKEPCILAFADKYNLDFITYSAEELNEVMGEFQESEFVKSITGVGNVCERSAIKGCENGSIILEKQSKYGMTIALAKEMRGISFE